MWVLSVNHELLHLLSQRLACGVMLCCPVASATIFYSKTRTNHLNPLRVGQQMSFETLPGQFNLLLPVLLFHLHLSAVA